MAINSVPPEALRTNHPYLSTSPRLSGLKMLEAKNPNSNFMVSPRVLLCFKRTCNHSVYTHPGLPFRKHTSIGSILTSQQSIFKFSNFSHSPLWNLLATGAQQTYQGVGDNVQLLCRPWPPEFLGGSSRVKLHFFSCSGFTAPSHSRPPRGLLVATGVSVSAVRKQQR
jgi:hypothetical protein